MNVLVAEDNRAHQELLEVLIRSGEADSHVTVVDTGEAFVRQLRAGRYDVALLDYHLPDCDAPQILPQIDEVPGRPPVIVVSSDGDSETIIASLRSGGRDFLPKSEAFNAAGLISRIRAVLGRQREERQLVERQKDECIAALAGGLAHDFNNMLVGILGKASMLRNEESRDKRIECCDAIVRTGERLADLARQLLAYARGGKYNPRPTAINEVIDDTLAMLIGTVAPGIEVRDFLSDDLWQVEADRAQLVQAMLNLCLNACEAMGRQGTLSVFTENICKSEPWIDDLHVRHPAGEYVHVVVADTGCGVSDAVRATMFEPYHSTKGDGRGLGLAAVKGIVNSHGGGLLVTSLSIRGTAFHMFLPRAAACVLPPEPEPELPVSESGARILVVEDEVDVREVVCEILTDAGHRVVCASTGDEALEAAAGPVAFDLVLLDMRLADCSGLDVLRRLRRQRQTLPAILCSGYERAVVLQEALTEFEDVPFLAKPFLPAQLLTAVTDTLRVKM